MTKAKNPESYYQRIKSLNIKHYSGEVPYYSTADLRLPEKAVLKRLKQNSTLLDLGCGSGRFSIGAAKLDFKVTGVDITPDAILAAKKRAKELNLENTNFKVGDMTELDLESNSFDNVICPRFVINAVSTSDRREMAVNEMLRVVKPGGRVFIESFNRFWVKVGILKFIGNIFRDLYRNVNILAANISNREYIGLYPGDMIYPANKVRGASEGYAHIPTVFELKNMIPQGYSYSLYSIPEIVNSKKFDPFKYFRYSIWIEIQK